MTQQHTFDVVIVGAGGRSAGRPGELAAGPDGGDHQAVPDPLPHRGRPGRDVRRLANVEEDNWEWHTFDTIKGGDYLVDQDAAEVMCREAIDAVYDLEHMGMPFNRTPTAGSTSGASAATPTTTARGRAPLLLRRRPHRPHDPPDPLPAERQAGHPSSTSTTCSTCCWPPRTGGPPGWSPTSWPPASCTCSGPSRWSSAPAASGRCSRSPPTPTPSPATAPGSATGAACPWRTWSSSSSTRPACTGSGCCCRRPPGARAASCATPTARRSWSATPPPSRTSPPATWSAGPSTPRSARAAAPGPTATTSTWTSVTSTPR